MVKITFTGSNGFSDVTMCHLGCFLAVENQKVRNSLSTESPKNQLLASLPGLVIKPPWRNSGFWGLKQERSRKQLCSHMTSEFTIQLSISIRNTEREIFFSLDRKTIQTIYWKERGKDVSLPHAL